MRLLTQNKNLPIDRKTFIPMMYILILHDANTPLKNQQTNYKFI